MQDIAGIEAGRIEEILAEAGLLYRVTEPDTGRVFIAAQGGFIEPLLALVAAELQRRPKGVELQVAAFEYTKIGYNPILAYNPDGVGAQLGFNVEPLYRMVPIKETAQ